MKTIVALKPIARRLTVYLTDDDEADCVLFEEALKQLPVHVELTTFSDGEQLLNALTKEGNLLPDVLFLDLNMPRKNGFVALGQIKRDEKLYDLPVIVFSTASDMVKVKTVYRDAAHYYIIKPAKFSALKDVIYQALTIIANGNMKLPKQENFLITSEIKSVTDEI